MKHILGIFTGMFLSGTSAALLHLDYVGMWYDPILWIEVAEVVIIYTLFILGIIQTIVSIRSFTRRV